MILLTSLLMLNAWTAKADNDRSITVDELPQKSQQFIGQYFPKAKILYAKMERDFLETKYEVFFADGTKVKFHKNGAWKEVACQNASVPADIVPTKIAQKIEELYPDVTITEIERDSREYEVKLSNRLELTFDLKFNLIDIDD